MAAHRRRTHTTMVLCRDEIYFNVGKHTTCEIQDNIIKVTLEFVPSKHGLTCSCCYDVHNAKKIIPLLTLEINESAQRYVFTFN